jgi:hypothetical protein
MSLAGSLLVRLLAHLIKLARDFFFYTLNFEVQAITLIGKRFKYA